MTIAQAEVVLRGKDETAAAFRNVIRNAETAQKQITSKFRSAFNLLGIGTVIYGLTRAVTGAIKAGGDLAKFAEKTGLAAEAASELTHAAKMQDIELGSLATGLKKMQIVLSQAGSGGKPALSLLRALGIGFEDIRKLQPDKQFELIAEQISKLKDPADRTRAAVEAFGLAGADLLPLFSEGAEGIRKLREETAKVFTAEDLKRLSDADDAMKRLKASSSAMSSELALVAAGPLASFLDHLRVAMGGGTVRENAIARLRTELHMIQRGDVAATTEELSRLQARLDLLMNPTSGSKRGRVHNFLNPVLGFLEDVEKQAKLTKKELEELERYLLLQVDKPDIFDPKGRRFSSSRPSDMVARNDASRLDAPLASTGDNAAVLRRTMEEINRENVPLRDRTIELGTAFEVADDNAKGLMETLKDESARRGFAAISDALYNASFNARSLGTELLNAFRRVLADEATQQIIALLSGKGGSGGGFFGAIASGIGALFGAGSGSGSGSGAGSFRGLAAHGMTLRPGEFAIAGEAGPEPVFGGQHGATIVPMDKMGRAAQRNVQINAPFNLSVRIDGTTDRSITQEQIERSVRAGLGNYHEFWRDQLSRGAFA